MMTKEEILKKVIKRSTENGFETYEILGVNSYVGVHKGQPAMNGCLMEEIDWEYAMENLNNIIFSINFAKAFWGTDAVNDQGNTDEPNENFPHWRPAWIYHLREMASEEDRLNYLKKFL